MKKLHIFAFYALVTLTQSPTFSKAGDKDIETIARVPLLSRSYGVEFSHHDILNSPQWDPLDDQPCPLSLEQAIALVSKDLKAKLNVKLSGPVSIKLTMISITTSDSVTEYSRYCYIIECFAIDYGGSNAPNGEVYSILPVTGAILLDKTLATFSFKEALPPAKGDVWWKK